MKVVVAPQEFKGSLSAAEAAQAMAEGVRRAAPGASIDMAPMADGGPGTVDVAVAAGARLMTAHVEDPLGRPVEACWALLAPDTAVIEMAQAAGLWRLRGQERDPPQRTSTRGVGQLIRSALDANCRRLIVGLGGSATNDGGAGMAQALGIRLLDSDGRDLPLGGAALARLSRIDTTGLDRRLRGCSVTGAVDVMNPLCGPEGASLIYGPQKGATPGVASELDAALYHYGGIIERDLGLRIVEVPGAGAAGGLGAGLVAFLGATLRPGVEVIAALVRLPERLAGADLILTGEGRLDAQTAYGKTVAGVLRMGRRAGAPVIAVAGCLGAGWESLLRQGLEGAETLTRDASGPEDAMRRARELLVEATERAVCGWLRVQTIRKA